MSPFRDRVEALNQDRGHLCIGVDPRPRQFPDGYDHADGLERWCLDLIEATAPYASAYKPNLAFYLAHGPSGLDALANVVDAANDAGAMTILDGKFGDIGSTAGSYADLAADVLGVDAVTLNPYMGTDVLEPFIERDLDAFVLARTTNKSARQIQDAVAGRVVQQFTVRGVGFVAPGNDPDTARHVRQTAGGSPLLLPGIGTQGGDASEAARTAEGGPFLINVSRSIALAEGAFPAAAADAAERFHDEIAGALDA